MKKILLIIFDGLADRPIEALGNKTPLQVANIPNLTEFAKRSECGTQNALAFGEYPTSEEAHLSIFGYDYKKDLPGRGVLEGLGINAPITKKDLVLRVDFGTVGHGLKVLDPRAGNINSVKSFCKHLGEIKIGNFTFNIYPGLGHRAVLVISGVPVSKEINHHSTIVTDTDPHKSKAHRGGNRVLKPEPRDNSIEARLTAEALWEYQKKTHEILNSYVENKIRIRGGLKPANFILTRGAGFIKPVESFHGKYQLNAVCVAGAPLYKGIARYIGMDVVEVPGATGTFETDINAKVKTALLKLKEGYDFCFLHLKGTDVVAEEEGDYEKKIAYLERADKALKPVLDFKGVVAITGDHATPCVLKDHSLDPVPFMITSERPDKVTAFNETDCAKGTLGHFRGNEIMTKLIKESKNV
jgi:2,3-bisphosphoglycerate-independent phosphoglycerate mutase